MNTLTAQENTAVYRRVGAAVIAQAVRDLDKPSYRESARHFLCDDPETLEFWCIRAGVAPTLVRRVVQKRLSGEVAHVSTTRRFFSRVRKR